MKSLARSLLFVPGNRPERIAKAQRAGAHGVIVDLEDAVATSEKEAARAALARHLDPAAPVLVRVNGPDTEWFQRDLEVCAAPGVAGVLIPKAEDVAHLEATRRSVGADRILLPLIETARGFDRARALAESGLAQRLTFGHIDFQLDLRIEGERDELLYFRSHLVLVSRLAGLPAPLDGVSVAIDDTDRVRAETLYAKRLGFGGKLCIHPKQVPVVNLCFLPSAEEQAWARRVLDAAAASQGSAVAVDGKMIDVPVIRKAEEILASSSE
ncbi:MAG: HpcH/HpaI aldolase/citrate lyase family protein [Rhodospirillaceae bacterium]